MGGTAAVIPIVRAHPVQRHRAPEGAVRRFHTMAKPIGSTCNLDCSYCFYLHKEPLLDQHRGRRMSDAVLESFIRQYIEAQDGEQIVFSWQGGEPTMLGLDYFERIVELQQRYRPSGVRIVNDLQTNATLLDDAWCAFLKQHDFLVGVSIDGPRALHDAYRVTRTGKPTFDAVMRGIDALKRHGVPFNALTVVNRINARRPVDVYRFLTQEIGATYIQFSPCVETRDFETREPLGHDLAALPLVGSPAARPGHPDSIVTDWSVDPDDWGYFLKRTFDEWARKDVGRVLVNLFETAVVQTRGGPSQLCVTSEFCGKALAIEHDGRVYSCDHFVYPEYALGDTGVEHLGDLAFSDRQKAFGFAKRETLSDDCRACPHLRLCWGECPKNRIVRTADGRARLNYLCAGLKQFFQHAGPTLRALAFSGTRPA
ncbi:anaerobic sulfatase maturase [Pararobbsia silviterrae]|uniref:Anaerobic sulfatase maturase n=1 Tax=Pararobbsia silviterrae TaxID=1792498 RepID=A0A494Y6V3_9BURK|nr:anaerobic sulfatase maturase [Pararobbsia silviterrae]RKP58442.1 anaerobic sulfatase maturase [Pararobbsia silviterrae]